MLDRTRREGFEGVFSTGGAYTALAPTPQAQATTGVSQASIDEGRALYLKNCSSCHGLNAEGATEGPSLVGVGAASVDFQVGTGRMPAAQLGAQVEKKPVQFTEEEIASLAAYVASLGPGPAIPDEEQLDYSDADIAEGGEIYRTNCAMCHGSGGGGLDQDGPAGGPSLIGVGPASVDFMIRTGRMPMTRVSMTSVGSRMNGNTLTTKFNDFYSGLNNVWQVLTPSIP